MRTLFWMSSGAEPTILARRALKRSNIVAEVRGSVLLIWGCNTVDKWEPITSKFCHEYPLVSYWTQEDPTSVKTGHLDPHTQEIIALSPLSSCKTHFLYMSNTLVSVYNGSVHVLNGTHPLLRITASSDSPSCSPPSWERETTAASNHRTPALTYDDLGGYKPEDETLGSMIHHLHNKDWAFILIGISVTGIWCLILAPILRLRQHVRNLRTRVDMLTYTTK